MPNYLVGYRNLRFASQADVKHNDHADREAPLNPRNTKLPKWTAFPKELTDQIRHVFEQNFEKQLGSHTKVHVLGKIFSKELCLRVGLHKKGDLKHQNFEVSVDHNGDHDVVVKKIHICVDAIAGLVQDFYDNEEDHELPYVWTEHPFQTTDEDGTKTSQKIYVQFSRENPDLEAEADRLLGLDQERSLVNEDDMANEIEGEGDWIEGVEPTMMGRKGKRKKEDMH